MRALPHIFARTFNTPLCIRPQRLEALIAGLRAAAAAPRIRLDDDGNNRDRNGQEPTDDYFDDEEEWHPEAVGFALSSGGIARITVRDVLVRREGEIDADSTELESYTRLGMTLRYCMGDARVSGVILDIDSCGGESGGLFDLCEDIRAMTAIKPIWAVANDDCLSAAYAIAAACDRIWTTRTGALGSVGCIALHTNQAGFDAQEGIAYEYVYAGDRKADFNPHEPLSNEARMSLQAEVDRIHAMFVAEVADGRGMPAAQVDATEAAVFFGENAVAVGLADDVGTFAEAVAVMSEEISGAPTGAIEMDPTPETTGPTPEPTQLPDEVPAAIAARVAPTIVRLDAVRQATGNVRRDNAEIVNLCAVAGLPQLAAEFIGKGTPVGAVRTELLRRRGEAAQASQVQPIDTSRQASTPSLGTSETSTVVSDRFARQMGRKGK